MQIILKNIEKIIPYARNPRINHNSVDSVAASIREFGFQQPIVVDQKDVVIAGHTRLLAAKKLGFEEVPVVIAKDLDKQQIKAYRILDNKVAEKSSWDDNLLALELDDLDEFNLDQFDVDFELSNSKEFKGTGEEDEVPNVRTKPITQLGDIWRCGPHTVVCNSCFEIEFPEFDAIITDPPYGINEQTDRVYRSGVAKGNTFNKIIGDNDKSTAYEFCKKVGNKPAIIFGANHFSSALPESASWIVWDKRVEEKEHDFNSDCELAWAQGCGKSVRIFRHKWKGLIKDSEHGIGWEHPTQKPIALFEWCINHFKSKHNVIFDPFLGSGSTLIACQRLNRVCYGMEIEPSYVDVICKRFFNETGIVPVKENGKEFPCQEDQRQSPQP